MTTRTSNMASIDIIRKSYEQIKQYPLFFFNAIEEWDYCSHQTERYWRPEAVYFYENKSNRISKDNIESSTGDILFAYGKPLSEQNSSIVDYIKLSLEPFDSSNIEHVKSVLTLFLTKAHNPSDKYSAREFLWMLNSYNIEIPILEKAIDSFDNQTIQPFFWNSLRNYSMCLSLPKQKVIKEFLEGKGLKFANENPYIYIPYSLEEALHICFPDIDFSKENRSIFQLMHIAVITDKYKNFIIKEDEYILRNTTNIFLKIRRWLKEPEYNFTDFDILSNFFRLFYPRDQLLLIRRYFHAVRMGYTPFSQELLRTFYVNNYDNWGVYYHCIHEASKPVRLAVPLLCDNILTFLNSDHTALQTINGTLDMAFYQCDTNYPEVDFGLRHIVPICNGGAVPNLSHFSGFICYKIVSTLNEKSFCSETIIRIFRKYLGLFGHQQREQVFNNEDTSLQKCKADCADLHTYDICQSEGYSLIDKYSVKLTGNNDDYKKIILSFFTDTEFTLNKNISIEPIHDVINSEEVKRRIILWLDANLTSVKEITTTLKSGASMKLETGWLTHKGHDSNFKAIINDFLLPGWCIIEPRQNSYIGRNVLNKETGCDEELAKKNLTYSLVQKKEHEIILPQITASLNEMLDVMPDVNMHYYIPYNEELMRKLKADFYTFRETENSDVFYEENIGFMTTARSKYDKYCAPKYENDINKVTKLPFMWCRGKECFRNSLDNQTLDSCKSWKQYTLLHLLEILGFKQTTETPAGIEASELIRNFIGMVNRADSLFKRVRCRECNHILFPLGNGSTFNRYNNFECRMPTCGERGKRVYLSQCHNCKVGLIDSRDSARCPHGWHICPKCLSCCDDAVYERMSHKYVLRRLPIPTRISAQLGHGHNDKDEYFCPKCGGVVVTVKDDHSDRIAKVCQECHAAYALT